MSMRERWQGQRETPVDANPLRGVRTPPPRLATRASLAARARRGNPPPFPPSAPGGGRWDGVRTLEN